MTSEEKIEAIKVQLQGIHPLGMTETELTIRTIITEIEATRKEKKQAKRNSEMLEFGEFEEMGGGYVSS